MVGSDTLLVSLSSCVHEMLPFAFEADSCLNGR